MKTRTLLIVALSLILISAIFVGTVNALGRTSDSTGKFTLDNVRAYASSATVDGPNFAVDGGDLFVGVPGNWMAVKAPQGIVVNAVAIDQTRENVVYIGAANELAIYRSNDAGENWQRIPLTTDFIGGVTAIAVDGAQRLLYVGTDTAGLFRLRDVGSSVIVSGQLLLDEAVIQVVADSAGSGLALARTEWKLYRAENFGMRWVQVENLGSVATAVAIAATDPATVYVGTTDRGLLQSSDGLTWKTANVGLGATPGTRLRIDALAIDPLQPEVLYVASSYLFGSTTVHSTPAGVAMSVDGAASWQMLSEPGDVAVAELLPIAGEHGSTFALMTNSRTPMALGNAGSLALTNAEAAAAGDSSATPVASSGFIAWVVAGLASVVLLFAVGLDLAQRRRDAGPALGHDLVGQTH